jgi:hypothetical protein
MSKLIPLSKGKYAIVDDEDYSWLSQWRWHFSGKYARRLSGQWRNGNQKCVWMHREILKRRRVNIDGLQTDHINLNKLDNRRNNLRIANSSENQANTFKFNSYTSKYKGVCWHKIRKKWDAQIQKDGRVYHLGSFMKEYEAAKVYNTVAKKYFGEYARLNQL